MTELPRFLESPKGHFFLLGPRGTGKTWWTRGRFPGALRVDLLDPESHRELAAKPERLRERVAAHRGEAVTVIDEVQKLPVLIEVVHGLIEEKGPMRFILTGSSARKLRRDGVNLLGGRARQVSLHPYMAAELGSDFRLESALQHGLLPVVLAAPDPAKQIRAYNGLYLKEEVQAEGLVRNVGAFARFLEAMSFSHGGVLNLANISRDCQVSRATVDGYCSILEDLLLGYRVPVFTRRAKRAMASHPKFYFFDAGVFRANRPAGPLDAPAEAIARQIFPHPEPFLPADAGLSARLFNQTGRRSRSLADCMIAAVAIRCGAKLATSNTADFHPFLPHGLNLA